MSRWMLLLLCACVGNPPVSDDTGRGDSAPPIDTEDTAISEDTGEPGRFLVDEDGDGFAVAGGDCDDKDPTRRVGLVDLPCDGIDQDCDDIVDESSECGDDDGDGTTDLEGDCHDGDPNVGPHAVEVPLNGIDDDCDGTVDAGSLDLDGDGYDPAPGPDCDDTRSDLSPGALEIPDGVDQDCDGIIDEGTLARDEDGDCACPALGGVCTSSSEPLCTNLRTRDCDDGDATRFPGNPEIADARDNDCDRAIDEGTVRADIDGDGFSAAGGDCSELNPTINPGALTPEDRCGVSWPECATPDDCDGDGVTPADGDCHDGDVTIRPFATETIDGTDEDCDGKVDEDTLYSDDDGDGASEESGDCDDRDPARTPGRQERIDSTDEDCDGKVDEGTVARDDDGDGLTEVQGDCNDQDPSIRPGNEEIPANGFDDNCDGFSASDSDPDGDGFTVVGGDCWDGSAEFHPGAPELADNLDTDCDGSIDEGTEVDDADGDGFCLGLDRDGDGELECRSLADLPGDCDDSDDQVCPTCLVVTRNGKDDNCDGQLD